MVLIMKGLKSFLNGDTMNNKIKVRMLKNIDGKWFFRILGINNKIIAVSESYSSFKKAEKSAKIFNADIKIINTKKI